MDIAIIMHHLWKFLDLRHIYGEYLNSLTMTNIELSDELEEVEYRIYLYDIFNSWFK